MERTSASVWLQAARRNRCDCPCDHHADERGPRLRSIASRVASEGGRNREFVQSNEWECSPLRALLVSRLLGLAVALGLSLVSIAVAIVVVVPAVQS